MDKLAILIPCYNESRTIAKVVSDCLKYCQKYRVKIYVYDNNSQDDTGAIAKKAGAIVRYEHKQGKGNVLRRMLQDIEAECYILIDGDDTYPAELIEKMAQYVLEHDVDMVIGDRLSSTYFSENKRPFHNLGNALVRNVINKVFKSDIKDVMTGFRALSYRFAKSFPVLSQGFEIETEMTIHAIDKNMTLSTIPVEYRDRPNGSHSKLNTYKDGVKVLNTIVKLFQTYKPYEYFGMIALVLFVTAMAVFVPVVYIPYCQTGLVAHYPTLIVCGFGVIAAVVSYFSGLILSTIVQKDRQEFEFRLHLIKMMDSLAAQLEDTRLQPSSIVKIVEDSEGLKRVDQKGQ
ncbi:MAG: glycosyltransferase family 2 protein [Peptococcaceae bacterium]|nr:glycosyltransferase family 2 protein [Peptococcaceae bacterium]